MFAVELIKKERDKEKKQKDTTTSPSQPPITLTTSLLANETPMQELSSSENKRPYATVDSSHSNEKVEELTYCVLFFGLIVITMANRVKWILRLTLLNDIVRIIFAVVIIITVAVIISY